MSWTGLGSTIGSTVVEILPIVGLFVVFQFAVLRRSFDRLGEKLAGLAFVVVGLAFFLTGLENALFPIGRGIVVQLMESHVGPDAIGEDGAVNPWAYGWVYVFAAAIGFATTVAEPSLISVSMKAEELSGGTLPAFALRIAVALGVAFGVALGTWRIVTGTPLHWYITVGYLMVALQTVWADRSIMPVAYDSGGVTTSTVTVPVVSALGLGLASSIPGRSPLMDGFGLIAFASLFPIISVLLFANVTSVWRRRKRPRSQGKHHR